jgi:hypothetical protein
MESTIMIKKEIITSIAVEEASQFHSKLLREVIGGQMFMLVTLTLMAYFGVSIQWIVVAGFFLATGTVSTILLECVLRFDAGRAYLELWTRDAAELLIRVEEKTV